MLQTSANLIRTPSKRLLLHLYSTPKTLTSVATARDDYFAAIHHVSNIVRRDFYMERTLNKLRITVTPELVFRVLRACSNSPTESLRFFNWARTHPPYVPTSLEFEEIVKILARANNYQTMWSLIRHMTVHHRLSLSPSAVSSVIDAYGLHRHVDQAVQVFNKASLFNCPQNLQLYNALLSALCHSKLFHGAYALIRRMVRKGVTPDKTTYAVLVNAWCSTGKMREAKLFLKEMSDKGFNPPVRGRDLLVEGLLNAGYVESAKGMVRKMIKEGFVPDVGTFNALVETVCKSGEEVQFCVDLYHEVCALGMVPDVNTYKILIPTVSKGGLMDEAFRLLNNFVEDGHRPFPSLYAPVIKALCRRGQFDDAFCFFGDMKAKGHPPNRPLYTMLITMCGRAGKFVEAANYLFEMTETGLVPITRCFDMVTDGLKNCGKHDLAKRVQQLEVNIRGV
ncbi:pentatricopeptide repeat-containing protein At5g18390, mitochondrial [Abrus precatorius]|uniref:Pentatricopeptide repeat-containing protein At5g18390, mitochondrial n=1 Tax=Abrus precatorius TaxID=3816 RepID=A0A8B8KXI6_ABRPR|nr:pentatricopeptide repeat-containing protein At5g18390, mitochondrial [Abrus precatorius]XP_027347164.1 pentatricopeptide repeat-containing protein At5g18390, mitochondrial [Abrus precatorius]